MQPCMYILLNQGAGMSAGKAAAQASHAAVEAYRVTLGTPAHLPCVQHDEEPNIVRRWYRGGHYMKVILGALDERALDSAEEYIASRGFKTVKIHDEGRTEVAPMTLTAVGVELVDKDNPHVQDTFSVFPLYREPMMVSLEEHKEALRTSADPKVRRLAERGEIGMARDALREVRSDSIYQRLFKARP